MRTVIILGLLAIATAISDTESNSNFYAYVILISATMDLIELITNLIRKE